MEWLVIGVLIVTFFLNDARLTKRINEATRVINQQQIEITTLKATQVTHQIALREHAMAISQNTQLYVEEIRRDPTS